MLYTKSQCIRAIETIALALGDLNDQVVYVGGAVVGLYVDDPGAPEVRPTKDIDVVLEICVFQARQETQRDHPHSFYC